MWLPHPEHTLKQISQHSSIERGVCQVASPLAQELPVDGDWKSGNRYSQEYNPDRLPKSYRMSPYSCIYGIATWTQWAIFPFLFLST